MNPIQPGFEALQTHDFLSMNDLSPREVLEILDTAALLKTKVKQGEPHPYLAGLAVALLFEKPSLRTRLSFDVGLYQLGALGFYLSPVEVGLGQREVVKDVARVVSSMTNAIVARVKRHTDLQEMAQFAGVPVVNALSDREHPCQVLADLLTIRERFGRLEGLKLVYLGDGNNMAHSLMLGAALTGIHVKIIAPTGYLPDPEIVEQARKIAGNKSKVEVGSDLKAGVRGANIVYTDVWTSMGQENEAEQRQVAFNGYQLNDQLLEYALPDAQVLHCLPAHRGDEITDEVMEGPNSDVFNQAENRLHAQKALLVHLLQKRNQG